MICARCKNLDTKVIDSRLTDKNRSIRRRRECEHCQYRFTTIEQVRISSLIVVKKDDTRESYDRSKVEEGIWKSCQKRPITQAQIDELISNLEDSWNQKKEISSQILGEDIMEQLKKLDEVAYIRFASVYRSFKDLDSFQQELIELSSKNKKDKSHINLPTHK